LHNFEYAEFNYRQSISLLIDFSQNYLVQATMEIITCCQDYFIIELPVVTLARRTDKLLDKLKLCENSTNYV